MKTAIKMVMLMAAVGQVIGGIFGLFALAYPVFGLTVAVIVSVVGMVNVIIGTSNLMDAVFGDEGFFPLFVVKE